MYRPYGKARASPISGYMDAAQGPSACTDSSSGRAIDKPDSASCQQQDSIEDRGGELSHEGDTKQVGASSRCIVHGSSDVGSTTELAPEKCNPPDCHAERLCELEPDVCAAQYTEITNPATALPVFRLSQSDISECIISVGNQANDQLALMKQSVEELKMPLTQEAHLALVADENTCLTRQQSKESQVSKSPPLSGVSPFFAQNSDDCRSLFDPLCEKFQLEDSRNSFLVSQIWAKVGSLEHRMNELEVRLTDQFHMLQDQVDQKLASFSHRTLQKCKKQAVHDATDFLLQSRSPSPSPRMEEGPESDTEVNLQPIHMTTRASLCGTVPWSVQVLNEHLPIASVTQHTEILEGHLERFNMIYAGTAQSETHNREGSETMFEQSLSFCNPQRSVNSSEKFLLSSPFPDMEDWIPTEHPEHEHSPMPSVCAKSGATRSRYTGHRSVC